MPRISPLCPALTAGGCPLRDSHPNAGVHPLQCQYNHHSILQTRPDPPLAGRFATFVYGACRALYRCFEREPKTEFSIVNSVKGRTYLFLIDQFFMASRRACQLAKTAPSDGADSSDNEYVSGTHVCFHLKPRGIVVIQCLSKRRILVDDQYLSQGKTAALRQETQIKIGPVTYIVVIPELHPKSIYEACLRKYDKGPSLESLGLRDSVQTKTDSTTVHLSRETDDKVEASPMKAVNCHGSCFMFRKRTSQPVEIESHASYLILP